MSWVADKTVTLRHVDRRVSNEAFRPQLPSFPARIHQNESTYFGPEMQRLPTPFDARRFYINHWDSIRATLERHRTLGLALLVFTDERHPASGTWIEARLDRTSSTVLGRHTSCAVAVPRTATEVSLRHAVVCARAVTLSTLRARIFDLRTQFGFADETGRDLRGVTIDGTSFFRFGDLIVLALVTGEDPSTYRSAVEAYEALPPRVFIDADQAAPTDHHVRLVHSAGRDDAGSSCTFVRSRLAVIPAEADLLEPDEEPEGELSITTSDGHSQVRPVGRAALSRGLLFGRYERCDVGRRNGPNELSRVHLLLVRDRGEILAIDTASSNGSYQGEKQFRQLRLESGTEIDLAGELVVQWRARGA